MIDLDAIEGRARRATPGPFDVWNSGVFSRMGWVATADTCDTAEFFATARSDVPALIARVRELETQCKTLDLSASGFEADWKTACAQRDEARAEVDRLMHQLADATNESTHFQVMCKREGEEIERLARQVELLTDEREIADAQAQRDIANENSRTLFDAWEKASRELDEVRAEVERLRREVDEMAAELHALSVKYDANVNDTAAAYRRGAEAMRDACAEMVASEMTSGLLTPGNIRQVVGLIRALPIPEEP
jgi:predicted  nucleic acid-binding Zn-ribbon protein